jgi:hypothetical protein
MLSIKYGDKHVPVPWRRVWAIPLIYAGCYFADACFWLSNLPHNTVIRLLDYVGAPVDRRAWELLEAVEQAYKDKGPPDS